MNRLIPCIFVALLMLLASSCGGGNSDALRTPDTGAYLPPNEEVVQEYIAPAVLELLRSTGKFEVYSLNKQAWHDWHRDDTQDGLLGEAKQRLSDPDWVIGSFRASAAERSEVLQNLYEAIGQGTGPRDCFYPTYAIYVEDGGVDAVVLFCSVCGCIVVLDSATTTITRRPMPVHKDFCDFMDGLLDKHWIRSSR